MKVMFTGVMEKKASGCKPCGMRKVSRMGMTMRKTYMFPSGQEKKFFAGREVELIDTDGEWLLKNFPDAFEEVE